MASTENKRITDELVAFEFGSDKRRLYGFIIEGSDCLVTGETTEPVTLSMTGQTGETSEYTIPVGTRVQAVLTGNDTTVPIYLFTLPREVFEARLAAKEYSWSHEMVPVKIVESEPSILVSGTHSFLDLEALKKNPSEGERYRITSKDILSEELL